MTDEKIDKGYRVGTPWNGEPRWECEDEFCAFDALTEERMRKHVESFHRHKTQLVNTGLLDENGKPIVVER